MSAIRLSGKDVLLSLLYSPGVKSDVNEPIIGRTKLTKMIFLFEKEVYENLIKNIEMKLPRFEPYDYGPFSRELMEDLKFLLAIGLVITEETYIPISNAERFESEIDMDDDWVDATFDDSENDADVELKYLLSKQGIKYTEERVWGTFSDDQKAVLAKFKRQVNTISLDSLLKYVYNKYPETAENSLIAERYLKR
jgi:uncharacterized protein YwgA